MAGSTGAGSGAAGSGAAGSVLLDRVLLTRAPLTLMLLDRILPAEIPRTGVIGRGAGSQITEVWICRPIDYTFGGEVTHRPAPRQR